MPGLVEAVRVVTHNDDFKLIANHYKCLPLPKVILVEPIVLFPFYLNIITLLLISTQK